MIHFATGISRFSRPGSSEKDRECWHPTLMLHNEVVDGFAGMVARIQAMQGRTPSGIFDKSEIYNYSTPWGKPKSDYICAPTATGKRLAKDTLSRRWTSLDLDKGDHAAALGAITTSGLELAFWETHSSEPGAERWRILFALDADLDYEGIARITYALAQHFGAEADSCVEKACQPLFIVPSDKAITHLPGKPVATAAMLDGIPSYSEISKARAAAKRAAAGIPEDAAGVFSLDDIAIAPGWEGTVGELLDYAGTEHIRCKIPGCSGYDVGNPASWESDDSGFIKFTENGAPYYVYKGTGTWWLHQADRLSLQGVTFSGPVPGSLPAPMPLPMVPSNAEVVANAGINAPPPPTTAPSAQPVTMGWGDLRGVPPRKHGELRKAIAWIVRNVIPDEKMTLLFGPPGSGKTLVAVYLLAHALGALGNRKPGRRAVCIVENVRQWQDTWEAICPDKPYDGFISIVPARLLSVDELAWEMQRHEWDSDPILVIDTQLANLDTGDTNDSALVARAMSLLTNRLTNTIIIGHTAKAKTQGGPATFLGSVAWMSNADSIYSMLIMQNTDGAVTKRTLACVKDKVGITGTVWHVGSGELTVEEYDEELGKNVSRVVRFATLDLGSGEMNPLQDEIDAFKADLEHGKKQDAETQKLDKAASRKLRQSRLTWINGNVDFLRIVFREMYPYRAEMRSLNIAQLESIVKQELHIVRDYDVSRLIESAGKWGVWGRDQTGQTAIVHPLEARRPDKFDAWLTRLKQ